MTERADCITAERIDAPVITAGSPFGADRPRYQRGDWVWARGNHGLGLALVDDIGAGGDRVVLCFPDGDRVIRSVSEIGEDEARYPF